MGREIDRAVEVPLTATTLLETFCEYETAAELWDAVVQGMSLGLLPAAATTELSLAPALVAREGRLLAKAGRLSVARAGTALAATEEMAFRASPE